MSPACQRTASESAFLVLRNVALSLDMSGGPPVGYFYGVSVENGTTLMSAGLADAFVRRRRGVTRRR